MTDTRTVAIEPPGARTSFQVDDATIILANFATDTKFQEIMLKATKGQELFDPVNEIEKYFIWEAMNKCAGSVILPSDIRNQIYKLGSGLEILISCAASIDGILAVITERIGQKASDKHYEQLQEFLYGRIVPDIVRQYDSEKVGWTKVLDEVVKTRESVTIKRDTAPRLLNFAEILSSPPQAWLVDDLIPVEAIGMFYGDACTGKTYAAQHASLCIASGTPYFGKAVNPGSVVYIAAEGQYDVPSRFLAWMEASGKPNAADNVLVMPKSIGIDANFNAEAFIEEVKVALIGKPPLRLIVIDTMHRCSNGLDENNASDTGSFIASLDKIKQGLKASILIVHHSGKDEKKGARGSSSLKQDIEFSFRFKGNPETGITMQADKVKSTRMPDTITLKGRVVELQNEVIKATWPKQYHSNLVLEPTVAEAIEQETGITKEDQSLAWRLLILVGENFPLPVEEIVKSYALKNKTVKADTIRRDMKEGFDKGYLERVGTGKKGHNYGYKLTAEGQQLVEIALKERQAFEAKAALSE